MLLLRVVRKIYCLLRSVWPRDASPARQRPLPALLPEDAPDLDLLTGPRTASSSVPPPPLMITTSVGATGTTYAAGALRVPTMDTLYESLMADGGNRDAGPDSTPAFSSEPSEASADSAPPAPPAKKSSLRLGVLQSIGALQSAGAASDGAGEVTMSRGRMLTRLLKDRMHKAHDVKVALEAFHVHKTEGNDVPASREGLLEAAVKLVGDDVQMPVLQGYNPNTFQPPLRFGDTVALVVDQRNAVVAFAGAQDGRPWVEVLGDRIGMPPNSEACQWRLEPASRHDMSSKLKHFLKNSAWCEGRGLPVPDIPDKQADLEIETEGFIRSNGLSFELSSSSVRELFEILATIGDERETNKSERLRLRGREIKYGNAVDLVHVLTGTRITMSKERAIEHEAKKVCMHEDGTNLSAFIVRPAFRTYNDGSVVASGDLVQLETRKTVSGSHFFLHMSNSESLADDPDIVRRQLMTSHPYITAGQELNAAAGTPSLFRLLLFRTWETAFQNEGVLRGDDVFTFYHKEAGGYLHYDAEISERPFFYQSTRVAERTRKKSKWYWRVQSCQLKEAGNQIPAQEFTRLRYRIKHVISEKYLVQRGQDIHVTEDFNDPACLFLFRPFSKGSAHGFYSSGDQIFVRGVQGEYMTQVEENDSKAFFAQNKEQHRRVCPIRMKQMDLLPDSDALVIVPVRPSSLQGVVEVQRLIKVLQDMKEQLELLPDRSPEKFDVDEAMRTAHLRVAAARLSSTGFLDKTIDGEGHEGVMEIYQNCAQSVELVLTRLVMNLTQSDDLNPMSREGPPNRLLQKILRELNMLPLAIRVLQLPFEKGVDINEIRGNAFYQPLVHINNLLYRVLKQIVKGNLANSKLLFEFLPAIRRQLGKGILITPTIKEIFLRKRELLNHISSDLIDDFISLLKVEKV